MSHNTWLHRGVRGAVRPLVNTPITPNHITTLRLLSGLAAAWMFSLEAAPWHYYGAALFVLSMLLDRADGELARQGGKTSKWGHLYDLVVDSTCNAVVFVGIGFGQRGSLFGDWAILMGLAAGAGVAAVFLLVMMEPEGGGPVPDHAVDPDDAMLVVPLAMALGGGVPLIAAAAVGAPLFALYRVVSGWGGKAGP